jgi:hypothetical protein
MWNGFDFYHFYFQTGLTGLAGIFFACGGGPFGRRPHYPDDPVDPVQLFSLR